MKSYDNIYRLALKARGGDRAALSALVDAVRMRLLSIALAVSGNYADAQDAVASAFVEICLHIGDLREPQGITAWMDRIVRREALRIRRKPSAAALTGDEADRRQDVVHSAFRIDVERALHRLPANHALALQLFYFDDLSLQEIAVEMSTQDAQINIGQVKAWLHRGRRQLAGQMKGYDEMKTKTVSPKPRRAALFCSDLSGDLIAAITEAMRGGGFEPDVITHTNLPGFTGTETSRGPSIWTKDHIAQSTALTQVLRQYDALVFDEQIGTRSGLEYGLFCKSTADTVRIPVTLLHSRSADAVFIQACATLGVGHLIDKSDIASISTAFRLSEGGGLWQHFSDDARQVIHYCQEEVANLHDNYVSTEHLLLGLMRDPACLGARVLDTHCGTSLEAVRTELAKHLRNGPGRNEALGMQLTPRSKRVIDLSYEEAKQTGHQAVGSEHILLGLIGEPAGLAGQVLATLGVDLDKTRAVVVQKNG